MTRTAISPRLAMRTFLSTLRLSDRGTTTLARPVGWVPCRSRATSDGRRPVGVRCPARRARSARPALRRDRLDQPLPARRGPRRRPEGVGGGGRPPDARAGAGSGGAGRRRRAPTCWLRCSSGPTLALERAPPVHGGGGPRRGRRRASGVAGVMPELKWPNDLVVGRAQAGGHPGRGPPAGPTGRRRVAVVVGLGLNVRLAAPGRRPTRSARAGARPSCGDGGHVAPARVRRRARAAAPCSSLVLDELEGRLADAGRRGRAPSAGRGVPPPRAPPSGATGAGHARRRDLHGHRHRRHRRGPPGRRRGRVAADRGGRRRRPPARIRR